MAANMTDDFFLSFFLLKLKILETKVGTTFSEKNSWFLQHFRLIDWCLTSSEQFFSYIQVFPTSLTAGVRDQDQSSQKLVKCDRRQSHICFRLIGYDTKHLEYF
jgi:hypothetical protein